MVQIFPVSRVWGKGPKEIFLLVTIRPTHGIGRHTEACLSYLVVEARRIVGVGRSSVAVDRHRRGDAIRPSRQAHLPPTAARPQNARPLPGGLLQIRQVGARDASVRSARAQEVRAEDDDGLREIIRSGSGATGDGSAHHILGDKSATASDPALAGRLARTRYCAS